MERERRSPPSLLQSLHRPSSLVDDRRFLSLSHEPKPNPNQNQTKSVSQLFLLLLSPPSPRLNLVRSKKTKKESRLTQGNLNTSLLLRSSGANPVPATPFSSPPSARLRSRAWESSHLWMKAEGSEAKDWRNSRLVRAFRRATARFEIWGNGRKSERDVSWVGNEEEMKRIELTSSSNPTISFPPSSEKACRATLTLLLTGSSISTSKS